VNAILIYLTVCALFVIIKAGPKTKASPVRALAATVLLATVPITVPIVVIPFALLISTQLLAIMIIHGPKYAGNVAEKAWKSFSTEYKKKEEL
jgi:hypothetical protein